MTFPEWIYRFDMIPIKISGFPGGSGGEEYACKARYPGSIPGSGRSPEEDNSYPLQYSCLENSMDREAWQITVHGGAKSWTRLFTFYQNPKFFIFFLEKLKN